jgi:hypothetical protein
VRPDLDLKLLVSPRQLSMREVATFQAGVEATNRSAAPIQAPIAETILEVDGHRCSGWERAMLSAEPRPDWLRVSPAHRLSIWWPLGALLGASLFRRPGRYRLVLRSGDDASEVEVEVTP